MAYRSIITNQAANVDNSTPTQLLRSRNNNIAIRATGTFDGAEIIINAAPTNDGSSPEVAFVPINNGYIYEEGVYVIDLPLNSLISVTVKNAGSSTSVSVGVWS